MPIIDRIENPKDKRVAYIKNPSRLHSALSAIVGQELGCWILVKK